MSYEHFLSGYQAGAKAERQHGTLNSVNADLRTENEKLRQAVRDLTASSEKLRRINQKATREALRILRENARLRSEIEQLQKPPARAFYQGMPVWIDVQAWEKELEQQKQEISRLKTELQDAKNYSALCAADANRLSAEVARLNGQRQADTTLIQSADQKLTYYEQVIRDLETENANLKERPPGFVPVRAFGNLEADRNRLRDELESADQRIQELEQCVESLRKNCLDWTNRANQLEAEKKSKNAVREQVRPILFAIAELYSGHPVKKVSISEE